MEDKEPICGYKNKKEMLSELYVKDQLSIAQIAERVDVGTATIERWLRLLDIPRRSRGGANSTAKLGWILHRIDPRVLFGNTTAEIAHVTGASPSFIWKYKKGVTNTWNSVSSHQHQDLSDMQP